MRPTRASGRNLTSLSLEALESRFLLDTGLTRFASLDELRQYLVDSAVQQWQSQFGLQWTLPDGALGMPAPSSGAVAAAAAVNGDFSGTNVQEAGVDEGDLVKTDGNYLYLIAGNDLKIVDARPARDLAVVAQVPIEGDPIAEYLAGNRVTIVSSIFDSPPPVDIGVPLTILPQRLPSRLKVSVFDVTNAAAPQLVKSTYFDGNYLDARAIDNQIHFVVQNHLGSTLMPLVHSSGTSYRYETEAEFRARLTGTAVEDILPHLHSPAGSPGASLTRGRLLTAATDTYKPLVAGDNSLVSIVTIDVTSSSSDPAGSIAALGSQGSMIYASTNHLYLAAPHWSEGNLVTTALEQYTVNGNQVTLTATGSVPGLVLNQFAMDEEGANLRVATTTGFGPGAANNVYVVTPNQGTLTTIGALENLAPGERIFAARFEGDRGYLVTFLQTDPLFVLDLHDPTRPTLAGELHIPGFSRYLHPIDANHLLGIGRGADPATGRAGELQVSLYDVANPSAPRLLHRFEINPGNWAWSEAEFDHHAVGYYPVQEVLALPVSGYTPDDWSFHSDLWVLDVDLATGFRVLGRVDHDTAVRRSVRIGEDLYSVAHDAVKVQPIRNPNATTAKVALRDSLLTGAGKPIDASEGVLFRGVVASFQVSNQDPVRATINWGDGGFSPGTITANGAGGFDVFGQHVFDQSGAHDVTVQLTRDEDTQTFLETTANVGTDPNQPYLVQLYRDLLKRTPDSAGLESWRQKMRGGLSRGDVVLGFETSREYQTNLVQQVYGDYLGRAAEPFGLTVWTQFLAKGGTEEQLRARILASEEFFKRLGQGTTSGYLQALYRVALARDIDPTGAVGWARELARGRTRSEVALAVLQSVEARTATVRSWYHDFLDREADDFGLQVFVAALQRGQSRLELLVAILSSEEYRALT